MKKEEVRRCLICDRETNENYNIGFKLKKVCSNCVKSLMIQELQSQLENTKEVKPDTNIEEDRKEYCEQCGKLLVDRTMLCSKKCEEDWVNDKEATPRVPSEFTVKELAYLEKQMVAERFGKEETIDTELNTLDLIGWEVLSGKIKDKIKLLLEQNESIKNNR